jgi:hypothetical protein
MVTQDVAFCFFIYFHCRSKKGGVAGRNVTTGLDVKNPGVKTGHKQRHNGDKTHQSRFVPVFWLCSASQTGFLVHHAAWQAGNPDALLFVFVVAGNAFAGRHY